MIRFIKCLISASLMLAGFLMTQEGRRQFTVGNGEMRVRTFWLGGTIKRRESIVAASLFKEAKFVMGIGPLFKGAPKTDLVVRLADGVVFFRVRTSRNAILLKNLYAAVEGNGVYEIEELNDLSLFIGGIMCVFSVLSLLSAWGWHKPFLRSCLRLSKKTVTN